MKQTLLTLILFLTTLLAGAQVIEETAPQPAQPKAPTYNSSLLLDVDVDCRVFVDGEQKAEVKAGEPLKIKLNAGQHLLQIKDMANNQLHKEVVELEKDKQSILSLALSGGNNQGNNNYGANNTTTAHITCIWQGADNIKMSLNNESYFLTPGTPKQLELTPGEGYMLKLEQPGKPYEYPQFLVFEAGYDTLYLQIEGEKIKLETPALRAETKRKNAEAINSILQNMVKVQGGTFLMGCTLEQSECSSDEKPSHQVMVSDYYIGKYEVTQAQWRAVMGNSASIGNPSYFKDCDDCPVESINYSDVQAFINQLNQITGKKFRLPTEAEWEYAARGGSTGSPTTYAGSNNIGEVAWYYGNSGSTTHPVGQKQANELGLYDMSGNVWEWCADWYGENYYASSTANNPQGPSSGSFRVRRGGSGSINAAYCRVAYRSHRTPDVRDESLGFRLSRDVNF